ncbi:hypothetical protein XW81_02135 [Buchnera aphidicola (Schlechtendalia chinensis)]|uniref:Cytochrome bo(3) ubiquinol oxidase subunit 4 n=1 Tax=Buchnera aphidicola subsp. Schlechtendalia chinensis TaxID=118110 RepID=A0A172WDW7_BUCSC|nr:cytochrome C oxidase subunit IV family protein [Buchnera aphidicola]ANF17180.1 hypothetical protein XW81_02135 [Buchnera aphidicola (Schlechtendalia chinensis)]
MICSCLRKVLNSKSKYLFQFLKFLTLIILTILPFFLVIKQIFFKELTYFLVTLCLMIQVLIHIKYFLHLNFSKKYKWNIISIVFTFLISIIIFFGSYWVMKNLNHNLYIKIV